MKTIILNLFLTFFCFSSFAQDKSFSVYLIGDAGEDTVSGKALLMLQSELITHPQSAVVFLGDNVYPSGIKLNDSNSIKRLSSQLNILKTFKGQAYFIPGNHDWAAQGIQGKKRLKNQELFVTDYLQKYSLLKNRNLETFLPKDGLPGPSVVKLSESVTLIMIDTQWFLHEFEKNKINSISFTKNLFYHRLDSILNNARQMNQQVIIATHHPIYTNGEHSRSAQPIRFLLNYTPFIPFGWLGLQRIYSQDIAQPIYKKMRKNILNIISKYDNITYVSGHDHNLQCFKIDSIRYIVSGAGSKLSKLRRKKKFDSFFQDDSKTGFVKIDFDTQDKEQITIFRSNEKPLRLEGY